MLEVCVDTLQSAIAAERAGAGRLELCAALDVGGVTPCNALVDAVRRAVACPLIVLLRPRSGNFVFDAFDRAQMVASAREALTAGADGLAVGGVTEQGALDTELLRALAGAAPGLEMAMHRAFDEVTDQRRALQQLIELGFRRVLTSGRAANAYIGVEVLQQLQAEACGRIAIMPGGGIRAENVAQIVSRTGCTQVHGSFRATAPPISPSSLFGWHCPVDPAAVAACRAALDVALTSLSASPR